LKKYKKHKEWAYLVETMFKLFFYRQNSGRIGFKIKSMVLGAVSVQVPFFDQPIRKKDATL